jgi:hypothetical protein
MNPFVVGVLFGFLLFLTLILLLRMTVPYSSKLFAPVPIPYLSKKESTDWLNFILFRILAHFQSDAVLQEINARISSKLHPHSFRLLSLGNAPTIPSVSTLDTGRPGDVAILIPIDWKNGPSLDFRIGNPGKLTIEVDLVRIRGQVFFAWPTGTERSLQIRFDHDLILNVEIGLQIGRILQLSITQLPLLGPVLTGLVVFIVSRQVFMIELPRPKVTNEVVM